MGFFEDDSKDHVYYLHRIENRPTGVRTKISHGEKELGEPLCHKVARQLHLSRRELDEFVENRMTPEEYTRLLRTRGVIR
jgi:hypothetical protein